MQVVSVMQAKSRNIGIQEMLGKSLGERVPREPTEEEERDN